MPTPVAASGGPDNLPAELLEGDESHRVHLDGHNRMPYLTGGPEIGRDEIIYCEGTSPRAFRYRDRKAHFVVQHHDWVGPKEELNAPCSSFSATTPTRRLPRNPGSIPSGWVTRCGSFCPAARLVQRRLQSFEEFPPRGRDVVNESAVEEQVSSEGGMSP